MFCYTCVSWKNKEGFKRTKGSKHPKCPSCLSKMKLAKSNSELAQRDEKKYVVSEDGLRREIRKDVLQKHREDRLVSYLNRPRSLV